ncbi:MAG: cation diffusion facilitator family transporter [Candidatus Micrarchaeota archaeon]|nr:cation diffusion facilitator family transporter [Candidatus Micrarchaeota archaeon]
MALVAGVGGKPGKSLGRGSESRKQRASGGEKLKAASVSIGVNVLLIALKFGVAVLTNSIGVIAELIHSAFDLVASVFAYLGIRKAAEPADRTHLYGHERFENLSSLIQTGLLVLTSLFIIYEAWERLVNPVQLGMTGLGAGVLGVAIVIDYFVAKYLHKTSEEHASSALEADAYHFSTDLLTSVMVFIGLILFSFGFHSADAVAALIVAAVMLFISFKIGKRAIFVLLDISPSGEVMGRIAASVSKTPGILGYHSLRARHSGNKYLVDVSIHLDPHVSVEEAHRVAQRLEKRLKKEVPLVKEVVVHVEPSSEHD